MVLKEPSQGENGQLCRILLRVQLRHRWMRSLALVTWNSVATLTRAVSVKRQGQKAMSSVEEGLV